MSCKSNLIPGSHKLTKEENRRGALKSAEVRRQIGTMKRQLELLLSKKGEDGKTYQELATLGLIKGAIEGNAQNYKVIVETLGESKQAEQDKMQIELTKVDELLIKLKDEAKDNDIK